jgi:integrase
LDLVGGELRVRRGKGKKPRQVTLPPSAVPAIQDWLEVRGPEPGSLFCAVLKSGRLVRAGAAPARLSPGTAWRICQERGRKGQIQTPAPHDLRRTWIGDLLDLGDLATVQKMAGHASASTTAGYDRRDRGLQRRLLSCSRCPWALIFASSKLACRVPQTGMVSLPTGNRSDKWSRLRRDC